MLFILHTVENLSFHSSPFFLVFSATLPHDYSHVRLALFTGTSASFISSPTASSQAIVF
jgi:hypothetical protein